MIPYQYHAMADLATNRRAQFDYEILETYEAGVELRGFEVKSVRAGRMELAGAFVIIRGGEAWLVNTSIPPYQNVNTPADYDPARPRRLLLHRRELEELIGTSSQRGLTLAVLRVYTKGPRIKVGFGLARRRKKHDERERIREREDSRKIDRALKEEH